MGRPPLAKKTTRITFIASQKDADAFRKACEEAGAEQSQLLRQLIRAVAAGKIKI